METTAFEDKDVQYAYGSVHDFFDSYHLHVALKETENVIKAATRHKAWSGDYPYRPIYFMDKMQELIHAAYCIHERQGIRDACIVPGTTPTGEPELLEQDFVCGNPFSNTWNNMPRHLSATQYLNPYKAINKFTAYMTEIAWRKACKDLGEYALSNSTIELVYPCCTILSIRLHLLRLLEACHLLELRSKRTGMNTVTNKRTVKTK